MVYGAVPPVVVITTEPVVPLLQSALVTAVVAVMAAGSVMVTGTVMEQPLASVDGKSDVQGERLVCAGVRVYGAVPPVGVITTEPLAWPQQGTVRVVVAVVAAGCAM